jgi:RNase P protein component
VLEIAWCEHMCMAKVKDFFKSEYVDLMPSLSNVQYECLKQSIKKWGGLLIPIIINQDDDVLDGYQRLMACRELRIPPSFSVIDFTDRPQDELEYIMAVNLHRRHLNEFQRAKIGLKVKKKVNKIAAKRKRASQFTKESGKEAAMKKHYGSKACSDTNRISLGSRTRELLAKYVCVSPATIERVETILEEGSLEQKASVMNGRSGIKTIYEKIQFGKLQSRLQRLSSSALAPALRKHTPKLLNKDFSMVTQDEIPDGSVDLVLVLNFPEAASVEMDKGGVIYEKLMECASRWLKARGLLVMQVEQHFLPSVICSHPPLQFYHLLNVTGPSFWQQQRKSHGSTILVEGWRPYCIYVTRY